MSQRRVQSAESDLRPISVLLAEDEESFIDALVIGLGNEGFKVTVARDGVEALRSTTRTSPTSSSWT